MLSFGGTCFRDYFFIFLVFTIVNHTTSSPLDGTEHQNESSVPSLSDRRENTITCQEEACQFAATTIRENMNSNISPCEDFYRFACENYRKDFGSPNSPMASELIIDYSLANFGRLKADVERSISNDDPKTFKKLQMFYNVCMNESHIDASSEAEFGELLKKIGDWPVLVGESWDESNFNLMETMLRIDSLGFKVNQLFTITVHLDKKNTSGYILHLNRPSFGIDREYLIRNPTNDTSNAIQDGYFEFMVNVARVLKANNTNIETELKLSLEFEKRLANVSSTERLQRDVTKLYNPTSIAEMQAKYPYIEWFNFFQRLVSPAVQLSPSDKINLFDHDYFDKIQKVLSEFSNRTLANYLFWQVARESVPYLSKRIRASSAKLDAELNVIVGEKPRWLDCVLTMEYIEMPIATGALYARRHLDEDSKSDVTDLFYRVQKLFNKSLSEADWMDNKTRTSAMEKLKNMEPLVAYPHEYFDNAILDAFHENMEINPASYLRTSLSLNAIRKNKSYAYLRKKVNRSDWTQYNGVAADVNAFYDSDRNLVGVTAGFLQNITFNKTLPKYVNYAGIGSILAHEISHGFDDQGRLKDKNGNLENWWDQETEKKFLDKTKCVADQYGNYSFEIEGEILRQNVQQTIGENIADIGALKIAYLAYEDWLKDYGHDLSLPGLEMFTSQQMFWISYANSLCAKYKPKFLKNIIVTDQHAIGRFRVIGSITNRPEFSRDFNCKDNSAMNQANKCNVW